MQPIAVPLLNLVQTTREGRGHARNASGSASLLLWFFDGKARRSAPPTVPALEWPTRCASKWNTARCQRFKGHSNLLSGPTGGVHTHTIRTSLPAFPLTRFARPSARIPMSAMSAIGRIHPLRQLCLVRGMTTSRCKCVQHQTTRHDLCPSALCMPAHNIRHDCINWSCLPLALRFCKQRPCCLSASQISAVHREDLKCWGCSACKAVSLNNCKSSQLVTVYHGSRGSATQPHDHFMPFTQLPKPLGAAPPTLGLRRL